MTKEIALIEDIKTRELFTAKTLGAAITIIEEETRSVVSDISTKKGRDEVISRSVKVRDSKTFVEKVRKKLGVELREELDGINGIGGDAVKRLQKLQDETRLPVTEFEEAEEKRIDSHKLMIEEIKANLLFTIEVSTDVIEEAIKNAYRIFSTREWEEFGQKAKETHEEVTQFLSEKLIALKKYNEEQAELEQLRADKAIQDQKDRDAQIAKDAANAEKAKSKKREDDLKASKAKAIQDKKNAVAKAKQDKIDADARAKKAAEDADIAQEKAIDDERQRVADEKQAEIDAEAKRAANTKHKAKINNAATAVLVNDLKMDLKLAKQVITLIAQGKVPNTLIKY